MKNIYIAAVILLAPAISTAQPIAGAPSVSTPPPAAAVPESSNSVVQPSTKGMAGHVCRPERWFPSASHTGTATLFFRIDATGNVESVTLKTSSGDASIDSGAIACVSGWRYVPAELNGSPIETLWGANVYYSTEGPPGRSAPSLDPVLRSCPSYPNSSVPNLKPTVMLMTTRTGDAGGETSIVQSSGDPSLDQFALACTATASFKQDIVSVQKTGGSMLLSTYWPKQSK